MMTAAQIKDIMEGIAYLEGISGQLYEYVAREPGLLVFQNVNDLMDALKVSQKSLREEKWWDIQYKTPKRAVDKRRYYFSLDQNARIEDAYFADYRNGYERERIMKEVWDANFKLYVETEKILKETMNPMSDLFPLYRNLGQDDEDFQFETREEALKEYEEHINRAIADRLYDL